MGPHLGRGHPVRRATTSKALDVIRVEMVDNQGSPKLRDLYGPPLSVGQRF